MEEYIMLKKEKARRNVIVFDDTFTSQAALSCEPVVSPLNDNEIYFRISFDEFDDEDYTGKSVSKNGYDVLGDSRLRLCHWLIACIIARRSQAPKKVTVTNLFYLRGMDVGSINILYLLAKYLKLFASKRKHGAMISKGQFVARLAEHFSLLTEKRL
nr:hypothetical protein [Tanacetum cinerariifolium]GEY21032.1 hypothetical protein [Tanacetum cinerariifolium]